MLLQTLFERYIFLPLFKELGLSTLELCANSVLALRYNSAASHRHAAFSGGVSTSLQQPVKI
jgi:hypothetical protein